MKYIIWEENGVVKGTTFENYYERVRNLNIVHKFDNMNLEDAAKYAIAFFPFITKVYAMSSSANGEIVQIFK